MMGRDRGRAASVRAPDEREGIDGRGGGGRLKKTDVWVSHISEVREME
jgi:hypothetical protein